MRGRAPGCVCTLMLRLHLDLHWWGAYPSSLSHMDLAATLALGTGYGLAEVRVGHSQWKKESLVWKGCQASATATVGYHTAFKGGSSLCWTSVECLVPWYGAARRGAEPPVAGNMHLGFICLSWGVWAELPTKSSFAETDSEEEKKIDSSGKTAV